MTKSLKKRFVFYLVLESISLYFLIVDPLFSSICRECVLCYIFCKCLKSLFLNTINYSLVFVIYLLKHFDKTVQTQYIFCCYWICKEYGDMIRMTVQCILLLLVDDEKLLTIFLIWVLFDLSIFLSCCLHKFVRLFWWRFAITLNLLFKGMLNWQNTALKTIKLKFIFSTLRIYFNSFFNFRFSESLFYISVFINEVAIFHFSLKPTFFSDMLNLANVGVSSFLHDLMYLISVLAFINFLCDFSRDRITVVISCICFFYMIKNINLAIKFNDKK